MFRFYYIAGKFYELIDENGIQILIDTDGVRTYWNQAYSLNYLIDENGNPIINGRLEDFNIEPEENNLDNIDNIKLYLKMTNGEEQRIFEGWQSLISNSALGADWQQDEEQYSETMSEESLTEINENIDMDITFQDAKVTYIKLTNWMMEFYKTQLSFYDPIDRLPNILGMTTNKYSKILRPAITSGVLSYDNLQLFYNSIQTDVDLKKFILEDKAELGGTKAIKLLEQLLKNHDKYTQTLLRNQNISSILNRSKILQKKNYSSSPNNIYSNENVFYIALLEIMRRFYIEQLQKNITLIQLEESLGFESYTLIRARWVNNALPPVYVIQLKEALDKNPNLKQYIESEENGISMLQHLEMKYSQYSTSKKNIQKKGRPRKVYRFTSQSLEQSADGSNSSQDLHDNANDIQFSADAAHVEEDNLSSTNANPEPANDTIEVPKLKKKGRQRNFPKLNEDTISMLKQKRNPTFTFDEKKVYYQLTEIMRKFFTDNAPNEIRIHGDTIAIQQLDVILGFSNGEEPSFVFSNARNKNTLSNENLRKLLNAIDSNTALKNHLERHEVGNKILNYLRNKEKNMNIATPAEPVTDLISTDTAQANNMQISTEATPSEELAQDDKQHGDQEQETERPRKKSKTRQDSAYSIQFFPTAREQRLSQRENSVTNNGSHYKSMDNSFLGPNQKD